MSTKDDSDKPIDEDDHHHDHQEEEEVHDVLEEDEHGEEDEVGTETEVVLGDEKKQADNGDKTEPEEVNNEVTLQHMEQLEAAKLKARYPAALKPGGHAFLQKRLNKGQKYFDSGDYNMAKAKGGKRLIPPVVPQPQQQPPTGEAIPTPDNLPTRKTSLVQSKLAAGLT